MMIDPRVQSSAPAWQLNLRGGESQNLLSKEFRCFMTAIRMHSGDWLTRGTVWIALTLYVASELSGHLERKRIGISWWLKTVGCLCFLGHVASAFHYFYHWSHAIAYADTARQSKELTGWDSGAGLYLNYLFALIWMSEVVWARVSPIAHSSRPAFWTWAVRGLFLFMIFNGAFVFVRGNMRWFGLVLCLALTISWWVRFKRKIDWRPMPKSS